MCEYDDTRLHTWLWINLLLSAVNSVLVIMREKLLLALMKSRGQVNRKVWLLESRRLGSMLCDCCFMFLHPYPALVGKRMEVYNEILGQPIFYHWNDVLHFLVLFRLVYFLDITFQISR